MPKYVGIYVPNVKPSFCIVVPGDDLNRIAELLRGRVSIYPFNQENPLTLGIWATDTGPDTNFSKLVVGWKAILDDEIAESD